MKRTTIHIFAAIALLLGLAACTQDEAGFLPEGAEGTPIVFTATGLNPAIETTGATAASRATVDGDWKGVQTVAVAIGGEVKAYDVTPTTADNTSATLTSTDPHYWTNHDNITVTAWWPYTEGETTPPAVKVAADQSARKDFEGSDLIVAEEQTVSYGNPTLRFTHRTARVTVVLTDYTEEQIFVRLTGLSTENGNPAVIAVCEGATGLDAVAVGLGLATPAGCCASRNAWYAPNSRASGRPLARLIAFDTCCLGRRCGDIERLSFVKRDRRRREAGIAAGFRPNAVKRIHAFTLC